MQVLVDTIPLNFELIEDASGSGKLVARGVFARGDQATANGRFYSGKLWNREITKLESKISGSALFGMLDHPKDGKSTLKEASHFIRSLKYDGSTVIGELEVLDTPMGNIAKAIIESGAKIGVSSRGLGSTRKDPKGQDVVQDDYRLLTFDLVADPAASTAWPEFKTEDTTQMEDAPMAAMTVQGLKVQYPDLINKIEAGARAAAEAGPTGVTKQEMEERLMQLVADQRAELEEQVRGEMLSDPEVGGSRLALDSISRILRPYILPEDADAVVRGKEDENDSLKARISELEGELEESKREYSDLGSEFVTAARMYFLEKKLSEHADGEEEKGRVISLMGDVGRFGSSEEFRSALASCCERVVEDNELRDNENERIAELEARLAEEQESKEKAVRLASALGARAYAERRLASHPHAPALREAIDSMGAVTNQQVDSIVEAWDSEHAVSDDFDYIHESVRGGGRGGLDHIPNDEDDGHEPLFESGDDTIMGVPKQLVAELAGIGGSFNEDNRPY